MREGGRERGKGKEARPYLQGLKTIVETEESTVLIVGQE
jgi:hypothetical protein